MNNDPLTKTFEAIYKKEADAIFRFCLVRVSDRDQALDITQETFTRLWRNISNGREMTNSRSLVFTIAHNLIIDWYRKKKGVSLDAMIENSGEDHDDLPYLDEGSDGEFTAESRFVLSKIGEISPSNRQAVYLRYVEDLSPPEIGEIMGISTNAASIRLNRGIEELRKITGYSQNHAE